MDKPKQPPTREQTERASRVPKPKTRLTEATRSAESRAKGSEPSKPIVFSKKKPAISSVTHGRVHDPDGCDECRAQVAKRDLFSLYSDDPMFIPQHILLQWFQKRREFAEFDEAIAVALSKGASIEEGEHTAEFMTIRAEDGSSHLKLVVR